MRRSLTLAVTTLTLGGAICATAVPASAQGYHGGGYHAGGYDRSGHHGYDNTGVAIAAGIIGLALGAAMASSARPAYANPRPYDGRSDYPPPAYGNDYGYGGATYRTCESQRWVWDSYLRRNVLVTIPYAC